MFSRDEIKEKIRNYIIEEFELEEDDELEDDTHLFDFGYIDSFGAVKLTDFVEETFNIEITNKDLIMYSMNTIEEISEVIEMKVN